MLFQSCRFVESFDNSVSSFSVTAFENPMIELIVFVVLFSAIGTLSDCSILINNSLALHCASAVSICEACLQHALLYSGGESQHFLDGFFNDTERLVNLGVGNNKRGCNAHDTRPT